MSKKLKTRSRSYETIASEAEKYRRIGGIEMHLGFDIRAYIEGPLRYWLLSERGFSLSVVLDDALPMKEPAKVEIDQAQSRIVLYVRSATWALAGSHHFESRRVLAHEIGHIALHSDEVYGFSEVAETEHRFIPNDELVENQAHVFADTFLISDRMADYFDHPTQMIDHAHVPADVAERRWERIVFDRSRKFGPIYNGTFCPSCGGDRVRTTHNYWRCDDCQKSGY